MTRFGVNADGTLGAPTRIPIPAVAAAPPWAGQIRYPPDGLTLIAPRQLAFVCRKLHLSNEGGRPARPGETTMDSYGYAVPADGCYGTSTTGSVSVIDAVGAGRIERASRAAGPSRRGELVDAMERFRVRAGTRIGT